MLAEYIQAAIRHATYKQGEDGVFVGEIALPGFQGVWSYADTLEACQAELASVLEEWILLGLQHGHRIPVVDGHDLHFRQQAIEGLDEPELLERTA